MVSTSAGHPALISVAVLLYLFAFSVTTILSLALNFAIPAIRAGERSTQRIRGSGGGRAVTPSRSARQ